MSKKNNNLPLISIIVPLYNTEKYIEQCLNSILDQTFQNYELIIIDDCSIDNSVKIIKSYIPNFKERLKLVKLKNNVGAAFARNIGINLSRGKYITFVDSDDFLISNALENFYKAAEETQADVIHTEKYFNCKEEKIDVGVNLEVNCLEKGGSINKITLETKNLEERIKAYIKMRFFWFPWGKLFNRDFIIKNDIKFPHLPTAEDTIFCFKCLCLAKNYVRIPDITNVYRIRNDSLTTKKLDAEKHINRWLNIIIEGTAIIDNFMDEFELFVQRLDLKYAVIDFFIQDKLNQIYSVYPNHSIIKIYEILYKEFSSKYGKNVASLSYLFNTLNIYRIRLSQLQNSINRLQQQIKDLQQK